MVLQEIADNDAAHRVRDKVEPGRRFPGEAFDRGEEHLLGQVFDRESGRGVIQVDDLVPAAGKGGRQPAEGTRGPADAVEEDDVLGVLAAPLPVSWRGGEARRKGQTEKDEKDRFPHGDLFSRTRRGLSNQEALRRPPSKLTIKGLMV